MSGITKEEATDIAINAADETVERVFQLLGVDINDQESVNNFRRDLIFAREFRKFSTGMFSKAALVVVGVAVAGGCAMLWRGMNIPK